MKRASFKGFTLAEVLITLGIIGVVASITIPSLISNYQKTQYVAGLKKAYTTFNQAFIQMAADYGCVGDLAGTGLVTDYATLGKEVAKYVKTVKSCNNQEGCTPTVTYEFAKNNSYPLTSMGAFAGVTADGTIYVIKMIYSNCATSKGVTADGPLSKTCGELYFDVNGRKSPNQFGRDTFAFYISNGKGPMLYPMGGKDDISRHWYSAGATGCVSDFPHIYGYSCTARIIDESWEMNY